MATDFPQSTEVMSRARWAYELSRLRRAALGALPITLLAGGVLLLLPAVWQSYLAAAALVTGSVLALWHGRALSRAVLPGVVSGMLPLACSVFANNVGHVCAGGGCYSLCLPLCTAGGAVAGLSIGRLARHQQRRAHFAAGAIGLAWAVGAMGCGCVGGSGAWGILSGMLLGFVASAPWRPPADAR